MKTSWILASCLAAGAGLALFAAAAQSAPESAGWRVFTSDEGRFRVDMPGKPVKTTETRSTIVGSLTGYRFEFEQEDSFFLVEFRDLPRVATLFMSSKSLVAQATDGLLDYAKGPVLRNEEITVDGEPARALRYTVTNRDNQTARARVILADRRLYLLIAGVPDKAGEETKATRFLDSFEFWKAP